MKIKHKIFISLVWSCSKSFPDETVPVRKLAQGYSYAHCSLPCTVFNQCQSCTYCRPESQTAHFFIIDINWSLWVQHMTFIEHAQNNIEHSMLRSARETAIKGSALWHQFTQKVVKILALPLPMTPFHISPHLHGSLLGSCCVLSSKIGCPSQQSVR